MSTSSFKNQSYAENPVVDQLIEHSFGLILPSTSFSTKYALNLRHLEQEDDFEEFNQIIDRIRFDLWTYDDLEQQNDKIHSTTFLDYKQ
jgi:hypothetical protein